MADVPAELAEALRDRYPIDRRLGSGGMAAVYLARDLKHDRLVALKVLRPELAATLGPERFEREIRLTARLQHPHVLTVLDSGQDAGQLWFTMPYVRGESLRDRLRREGPLPVEDALRITREALQALAYAHAEAVVHRDIKPENILLAQDGSTLVADFGIARGMGGNETALTDVGLVVGTPAYMSPEQAAGEPVDARSDLYSLACVCYEMLGGEPPFSGGSIQSVLSRQLSGPVPRVRQLRPSVPEAVDAALSRALAPLRADRFQSATAFARALQPGAGTAPDRARLAAMLGAALAVVCLLGLAALFAGRHAGSADRRAAGPRLLAVLPFENLGDSADGYFADGVTDEVRTKLSRVAGIEVIARASSNEYRRTSKPPQQIARELGVDYLLTATVRWSKQPGGASRVRVTPELVDVRTGPAPRTTWEEPFDAALTDVFQVQADISGKVAGALDIALADSTRRRLGARPTRNLQAYDALLRGDRLIITEGRIDLASTRQAAEAYAEATRLDSAFALAWARLARAEALRYERGEDPETRDSVGRAVRQAADRAVRLAPDLPEAHYAVALAHADLDLDGAAALEALEHARTLAPTDADVLSTMANILGLLGRNDESAGRYAEAARLDPRSPLVARRYAWTLVLARRFREADSVAGAGLEIAPDNFDLINARATTRIAVGDTLGARTALREALRHVTPPQFFRNVDPGSLWVDDSLEAAALRLPPTAFADDRAEGLQQQASMRWQVGRYAEARASADSAIRLLEGQRARQPADPRVPDLLALVYPLAGRRADAVAEIERWRALVSPAPNTPAWAVWVGHRIAIAVFSGDVAAAIPLLDTALTLPGGITRAQLRVDPFFNGLRRDHRFQRLLAGN